MNTIQKFSLVFAVMISASLRQSTSTPLDDYVNTPDPHYIYTLLSKVEGPNYSLHILNMTSQKWLTEEVTEKPIWWHYVSVVIPKQLTYNDTAFMWIDADSNTDLPPTENDEFVAGITSFSVLTGAVAATIKQIPNQPTVFLDDPTRKARYEDSIIAWTWKKFIQNGTNPEILLRLPMTKAVVRGLDTLASYSQTVAGVNINKFVVGGASKRGWTTWTTAAVDKRVVAMVPVVMDLLNAQKSLGGWTIAFGDYYMENITQMLDNPNMAAMMDIIDPLSYKDRYTLPKLIFTSSGDEFFLPDDSHYYYNQLAEPKFLRITPNARHSQSGRFLGNILSLQGFFINVVEKAPFPVITWTLSQNDTAGRTVVTCSVPPKDVTVYYANTLDGNRRDFRLAIADPNKPGQFQAHPVVWLEKSATKLNSVQFEGVMAKPSVGWAAFFIQLKFDGLKGTTLEFTTEVNIVPDVFPFPDCSNASCHGLLV